jgi:excisionase family DNA binding protein
MSAKSLVGAPVLMTLDEVAQLLRISKPTAYKWARTKLKPASRSLGRRLMFDRAAIVDLIKGGAK